MENDSKKYISLDRLSNFLDNIKAKYSQIGHKHNISDLTDYSVDDSLSSTSVSPVQNKVIDAEFEAVSRAIGALELSIDGIGEYVLNIDYNTLAFDTTEIVVDLSNTSSSASSVLGQAILGQMVLA